VTVSAFLALLDQIRELSPQAGVRSNFIVGSPGETAADLSELELFLSDAGLDAIGSFGLFRRGWHRGGLAAGQVRRGGGGPAGWRSSPAWPMS